MKLNKMAFINSHRTFFNKRLIRCDKFNLFFYFENKIQMKNNKNYFYLFDLMTGQ